MKIKYVAYDEKEFDNRRECEIYEEQHKDFTRNCGLYLYCEDVDHNPIDLSKQPKNIDRIYYITVKSDYGVELCKTIYKYWGVYMPIKIGNWKWNEKTDTYDNLECEVKELEYKLKEISEYKKRAKKHLTGEKFVKE